MSDERSAIPAKVDQFDGLDAICLVEVAGAELPTIFPADLLRSKGLNIGSRFVWYADHRDEVTADDIGTALPNKLTPEEIAEGERLQAELMADPAWRLFFENHKR